MKLQLTLISTFTLSLVLTAQIPSGYYDDAAGLTGAALKTALHNIIKDHTMVTYAGLWTQFETTDKKSNSNVWDIYSDIPNGQSPYEFTFTTNQCGNYKAEADCYNREHTWPQSWFNSEVIPSCDLFHIYPTDGYVNNRRGNYPYGDVADANWTSLNGSKLGPCKDTGYSSTVFEPIDEYKGDIARSYFYMSTRYEGEDAQWMKSDAADKATLLNWQMQVLLKWCMDDPVSKKEIDRNNQIYSIQHNRNPYIDHPEWINSIWISNTTDINDNSSNHLSQIYPNPAIDQFHLSMTDAFIEKIEVYTMVGGLLEAFDKTSWEDRFNFIVDCSAWGKGIYFIKLITKDKTRTLKFVKG